MGWKDTIRPIKDSSNVIDEADTDLEEKATEPGTMLETLAGTAYAGGQGLTGGFLDEILAKAVAGGEEAAEAIGLKKEDELSLADKYEQYKKLIRSKGEEYKEKAGMLPTVAAEIAGAVAGPGKFLKAASGLGLAGRLGVATGLGALEGYGRSEDQKTLRDVGIGAGTGLLGGAAGEALSAGVKRAGEALVDTQLGRQLLAVAKQASEGKSIYGEKAGIQSTKEALEDTATRLQSELTEGISEANKLTARISSEATQAGKLLDPEPLKTVLDEVQSIPNIKLIRKQVPLLSKLESATLPEKSAVKEYTAKMLGETPSKQTLTPDETLKLMDELRDYIFKLDEGAEKIALTDLKRSLETEFNKMVGEGAVKMIKATGHQARSLSEPFIQAKGQIIFPTPEQPNLAKQASDVPFADLQQTVRENIRSILRQAGKPSSIGQEARGQISEIPQYIKDINKIAEGKLPTIEDKITKELSQKSALIGAKQAAFGQLGAATGADIQPGVTAKLLQKAFTTPVFKAAEAIGRTKTGGNVARYLLEESDEKLFGIANQLKADPKFVHYGKAIEDALLTGRRSDLNPVIFSIMQNPAARSFVKMFAPGEENE